MKNFALLFFIFCSCQLFASDRLYNRLVRLYRFNPDKCLVVVKNKIKNQPKDAVSYFFAIKLYADKSEKNIRLKARYAAIYQSIGYAIKFERYSGADLEEKVVWENEKSALNAYSKTYILPSNSRVSFPVATSVPKPAGV